MYQDVQKAKPNGDYYSVIVGNKYDLREENESVPPENPLKLANKLGVKYFNTSALTMYNIDEAFNELICGVIKMRKRGGGGCCFIM